MAETGNIEELAKLVSKEIFTWFRWETCEARDVNWKCKLEQHKKSTHPTDVVFHYRDPYTGKILYILTDLKSYAKGSINTTSIGTALSSLSMAVECANISEDWQNNFLKSNRDFDRVIGLLFLFNHDNEFDDEIEDIIHKMDFSKIKIPEKVRLLVHDPLKISRMLNVVNDLKGLVAEGCFSRDNYTFFYPDLVMSRRHGDEWDQPASFEILTAPWLIVKFRNKEKQVEGFVIYYHKDGSTVDEFVYLIDALSRYQMLLSEDKIFIRFTRAKTQAASNFIKAKEEYLITWSFEKERARQLNDIDARKITQVVTHYCPLEIGMRGAE